MSSTEIFEKGADMDYDVTSSPSAEHVSADDNLSDTQHQGTHYDVKDMNRLGKKQEFMRLFRFYSILGFTSTLMCTWEAMLAYVIQRHREDGAF
jgi:hypothetical protein